MRKSITRLGGAFHQYHMRISQCSHVKLARGFCLSTRALTTEGLVLCMDLWECGSRGRRVDSENKVGLDRLKVLLNERIVEVCLQLQLF